jgi:hypothetical protein
MKFLRLLCQLAKTKIQTILSDNSCKNQSESFSVVGFAENTIQHEITEDTTALRTDSDQ